MGESETELSVLGIDLAKHVFELYGIDARGKAVLSKRLTRKKVLAFVAQLPACLVVMEACNAMAGSTTCAENWNYGCWCAARTRKLGGSGTPNARRIVTMP